jgi:ribosome maturation factor RimP
VGSAEAIRTIVEPALGSAGLELWDVETGRGLVRVLVDAPGGIDLDTLSEANRIISPLLDEHPELTPAGSYELEVSSPGVERTLRDLDHYRRYIGSEINVKTTQPVEGGRRHRGRLVAADEDAIEIEPSDRPKAPVVRIGRDQIERARTVLVWGPTPAPAARRRSARTGTGASVAKASAAPAALDAKDAGS